MSDPQPMPIEQRAIIKRKVDHASEKLRRKVDCIGVLCVAVISDGDGEHYHAVQGGAGNLPGQLSEFLKMLATAAAVQESTPGFEGAIQ